MDADEFSFSICVYLRSSAAHIAFRSWVLVQSQTLAARSSKKDRQQDPAQDQQRRQHKQCLPVLAVG
jgi:hypothetical protein